MAYPPAPMTLLAALLLAVGGAGCLQDWIAPAEATQRTVACAFLDPAAFTTVEVTLWAPEGGPGDLAATALQDALVALTDATDRPWSTLAVERRALPDLPGAGDDNEALLDWSNELDARIDGDLLRLDLLWQAHDAPVEGGYVLAPGILVVDGAAAASAPDTTRAASGLLRHLLGHALGAVNDGVPMQHNHEGAAKHDDDPDSVMHVSWHQPAAKPADAPLSYSDAILADWAAAAGPEGVCA
ncbi:MAG: hypothetical protein ACPGQL_01915 [Thermoplasmatota archaeon]